MGAGASVPLDTATEELKNRLGLFSLRGTQKQFLGGLSEFLRLVLSENTLFELEPILTNLDKCHEVFVVLSSQLKNEFRVLRLPDASSRGATHKVPFMTKKQYAQLETEASRQNVCNDIAWFILRYVTLVVALAASVTINPDMPALLERSAAVSSTITKNKTFRDIVLTPQIQNVINFNYPLDKGVLNRLLEGALTPVKIGGTDTSDVRPLFFFKGQERVILNTQHGYVYAPQKASTVLLSIEFTPTVMQRPQVQRSNPYAALPPGFAALPPGFAALPPAPGYAPPAPVAEGALPVRPRFALAAPNSNGRSLAPSEQTSESGKSYLGGKSRRMRRAGRKTRRRQRGGEGEVWFAVKLRNLASCTNAPCPEVPPVFYVNNMGSTIKQEDFPKLGTGAFIDSKPFQDRIEASFNDSSLAKVATVAPVETGPANVETYLPLNKLDASTFKSLKSAERAMETKAEGTSPAQYRAFLLATRMEQDVLHNLFCGDSWVSRRTTDMVPYALLNALYSDRMDGGRESTTGDELRRTLGEFMGAKVLADYVSIGSSVESFENTKFVPLPTELDAFCKQVSSSPDFRNSGDRGTVAAEDKEILLDAHKELRDLYDNHMQIVVDVLKRIVIPKKTYGGPPELLLTPEFETDERGALVLLNEIIAESRQKLATHYLNVEKVYVGALQKLRARMQGRYVSPKKV